MRGDEELNNAEWNSERAVQDEVRCAAPRLFSPVVGPLADGSRPVQQRSTQARDSVRSELSNQARDAPLRRASKTTKVKVKIKGGNAVRDGGRSLSSARTH